MEMVIFYIWKTYFCEKAGTAVGTRVTMWERAKRLLTRHIRGQEDEIQHQQFKEVISFVQNRNKGEI